MDAATLTIDSHKRRCCNCSASKTRCLADSCHCYKQGRQCDSDCESSKWTGDCLNKSIMRCNCNPVYNPNSSRTQPDFLFCNENSDCPCFRHNEGCSITCGCRGNCTNIVGHHKQAILDYDHFPKLDRPQCGCTCSGRGACRKFKKCLCLQMLTHCNLGCKCRRECVNTRTHCELSKYARNCFFDPEESPNGSTAIVHLIGANYAFQLEVTTPNLQAIHAEEILCRLLNRALSTYAIPIQHIIVYTPSSPCFHQDCHPRCEIVDNCIYGKSCATALSILHKQIRKLTRNTHLEMTIRFLNPYVARGDLYTKRAILALMENGIRVEPITIKDWADLMKDSVCRSKKRSMSSDRFFHRRHQESTEAMLTPTASAYHKLWNVADMDRFVRSSQHYINDCRRTLGYSECYWTSSFHDLLKMTVLTCAGASEKLNHISIHLCPRIGAESSTRGSESTARPKRQLSDNEESANVAGSSGYVAVTSTKPLTSTPSTGSAATSAKPTSTSTTTDKTTTHRIRCNSGPSSFRNSQFRIVNQSFVESLSKSVNEIEIDDEYPLSTPTTFNDSQSISSSNQGGHGSSVPPERNSDFERRIQKLVNQNFFTSLASSPAVSLHAPAAAVADKILMKLSGRNMVDIEQQEIKAEVIESIDAIQQQLTALMQYLDQKITSMPV